MQYAIKYSLYFSMRLIAALVPINSQRSRRYANPSMATFDLGLGSVTRLTDQTGCYGFGSTDPLAAAQGRDAKAFSHCHKGLP